MFMIVEAESSHTLFTQFPLPLSFQGKSSVDLTFVISICYCLYDSLLICYSAKVCAIVLCMFLVYLLFNYLIFQKLFCSMFLC